MLVPNIAKVVHKIITCGKKEKVNGTEVKEPPIKKNVYVFCRHSIPVFMHDQDSISPFFFT